MEEILKRHRQEKRDLQARITHKKKSATKKTRKTVNDECSRLEQKLEERQAGEIQSNSGQLPKKGEEDQSVKASPSHSEVDGLGTPSKVNGDVERDLSALSISSPDIDKPTKKPNRQKHRLARRAAEQNAVSEQAEREAADLPNLREQEMQKMREASEGLGRIEQDIPSDGHCLYAAIADQLRDAGMDLEPTMELRSEGDARYGYTVIRRVAAACIEQHPNDFEPFLEVPLAEHARTIRDTGEWGGHIELVALAKAYDVDINVLHADGQVNKIEGGSSSARGSLWLAYYLHSHGLGEHYNSLRRRPS